MVNAFTSETPQFICATACVWILAANCLEGSSCEATSVAGELLVALGKHMSLPNGFPKGCETHETPANENTMKQQGHWQLMLIVLFRSRLFAKKKRETTVNLIRGRSFQRLLFSGCWLGGRGR